MGKKDKKSKSVEQKARVAAKQSKKAAQKDKKSKLKGGTDSDAEEEDLELVLEEYARKQAQFLKVTESTCEPPSPRSSSTLIGSPSNSKELFLYGGEHFDGALATFFNDLFVYHVDRDDWKIVTSPNSPLPRSGHAWCRGGNAGGIYLFGGEFSSPKQGTFYHYNDFWRLDTTSREWTRLEGKGKSPPARSGHRMTYYKSFIILFGGFQDTSQQTRYLQDLWIYDCQSYLWHNPVLPQTTQKPDARSSFSFLPHDAGAVVYGGYSRIKVNVTVGNKVKGGNQASKSTLKPLIHQDSWLLRLGPPLLETHASSNNAPTVRWERRKKPANAPNPPRAGATQVFHKGRGISFGGVHDVEESEEGIESEFFNQLFAWNVDRNRVFPLGLRRARVTPKRQAEDREKRGRGKADEAELLRNLAALDAKGTIQDVDPVLIDLADENDTPERPVKPVLNTMPHLRFNAQLAIQGDTLFIFGGTFEQGDREYTFADMHAIDLGKMDGVTEIYRKEVEDWQGDHVDSASESDEDQETDDEDSDGGDSSSGVTLPRSETSAAPSTAIEDPSNAKEDPDDDDAAPSDPVIVDIRPHPRPFETLRDFFVRTSNAWQRLIMEDPRYRNGASDLSIKELKKAAFDLADTKWWDSREEINAEEEQQGEAGIGEVVSMADRNNDGGGVGRRR